MAVDEQILAELRSQTPWLRLLGIQALRPVLAQVLRNDRHRLAYELSDGNRTSRQVAEGAGVGAATVSRLWSEWIALGICMPSRQQAGRAEHLASLSSLGIEIASVAQSSSQASRAVDTHE